MINKRNMLLMMVTGVIAANYSSLVVASQKRPNILFAIADDVSRMHLGAYGCKFVRTPNFDRLAKQGILFTNCYTTNPKCSPSRATILTGRNTWELEDSCNHFGIFWNKFPVYPDILEASGYHIGYTGKGWAPGDWQTGGFKRNPAGISYGKKKLTPPAEGISKVDYAENFADFLETRQPNQPFYFWYGGHEAHRRYEFQSGAKVGGKKLDDADVPPYFPDDETVRHDMLDYAFETEWFDQHLGKMLTILEDKGELDNTLVVVTSDNGMPFPRVKGQIYDDDFHMPLAVCWGDRIKGGRVVRDYVSFSDFAPTFFEAAGITPTHQMTGKSIMGILLSEESGRIDQNRNFIVVGKERHDRGRPNDVGYPVRAIRTDEFMYAVNFKTDRWPAGNPERGYPNIDGSPTKAMIIELQKQGITRYWDLAMGKRPPEELYSMVDDEHCMRNLADDPKYEEVKADLRSRMFALLTAQKDPRILGNGDVFDNYIYGSAKSKAEKAAWLKKAGKK